MPCPGDEDQTCGGEWSISLYQYSSNPAEIPDGSKYLGCYKDLSNKRVLSGKRTDSDTMSQQVRTPGLTTRDRRTRSRHRCDDATGESIYFLPMVVRPPCCLISVGTTASGQGVVADFGRADSGVGLGQLVRMPWVPSASSVFSPP